MALSKNGLVPTLIGMIIGLAVAIPALHWFQGASEPSTPVAETKSTAGSEAGESTLGQLEARLAAIEDRLDEMLDLHRQAASRFDEEYARFHASVARLELQQTQLFADQFAIDAPVLSGKGRGAQEIVELDDAALEEDFRMRQQQRFDDLDDRLAQEGIDVFWRDDAVELINQASVSDDGNELAIDGLECRSTLCRFEIEHDGGPSVNTFIDKLVASWPWDSRTEIMTEPLDSGRQITTIFISRDQEQTDI